MHLILTRIDGSSINDDPPANRKLQTLHTITFKIIFRLSFVLKLFGVVHKGRLHKNTCFYMPLPLCPLLSGVAYPLIPCGRPYLALDTDWSMVWQSKSWCSQNMLLINLIIRTCGLKHRQNQQRVHVNNLTLGARPMHYVGLLVSTHIIFSGTNRTWVIWGRHHP